MELDGAGEGAGATGAEAGGGGGGGAGAGCEAGGMGWGGRWGGRWGGFGGCGLVGAARGAGAPAGRGKAGWGISGVSRKKASGPEKSVMGGLLGLGGLARRRSVPFPRSMGGAGGGLGSGGFPPLKRCRRARTDVRRDRKRRPVSIAEYKIKGYGA